MRRFIGVLCAVAVAVLPGGASASAVGELRVLAIRATWGPTRGDDEQLRATLAEAAAFYARASYGKLNVRFDLTQWLPAYPNTAICPTAEDEEDERRSALGPISRLARESAAAAGYDVAAYDRLLFFVPEAVCGLPGLGVRGEVLLADPVATSWLGVVHELGHTLGLAHATSARCAPGCPVSEYGDPYSPMGRGFYDFSAYEKAQLGWLSLTTVTRRSGTYAIAATDVVSERPQALTVRTRRGEFWIENRLVPDRMIVRYVQQRTPGGGHARSILLPQNARSFAAPGLFTARLVGRSGVDASIRVVYAKR